MEQSDSGSDELLCRGELWGSCDFSVTHSVQTKQKTILQRYSIIVKEFDLTKYHH